MTARIPDRPAAPPRAVGPAAKSVPPADGAARPGAPPCTPVTEVSAPGHHSPSPLPDRTPGGGEAQASGRQAWKDAIAANNRARRNRRGTRPGPQIAGVRAALRPRSDGR